MSSNTSRHVVCRLLGGSGRPSLVAVPTRKLPALFAPISRTPAGESQSWMTWQKNGPGRSLLIAVSVLTRKPITASGRPAAASAAVRP